MHLSGYEFNREKLFLRFNGLNHEFMKIFFTNRNEDKEIIEKKYKLFEELFRLIEDYELRKTIHFNCKKYFHENGAIFIEKNLFRYLNQHPEKLLSR